MDLDPLLLSRIQFAVAISFHILFPAFTIGLASWLVVLEAAWRLTGRALYLELSEFWIKIFAVSFGMGVVSGVVMAFQFGTNWSRLSDAAGNVLGPLLNYEVVTAFFLEASFLGILLFGRRRVPSWLHLFATCMVALGTLISSFWILSANSWMQTPAGHELRDGTFYVISWWEVVFNPSFPYRFAHMVAATYLTTAFVVAGVSAWHLLEGRIVPHARHGYAMALGLIAVLAPLQILLGDLHGLNTFEHQPAKVAAMEGHWETREGAPLILFALPDQAAAENRFELAIPRLGSLILTHDLDGRVQGLEEWPPEDRPYVPLVFFAFRIMVGIGLLMLTVAGIAVVLAVRRPAVRDPLVPPAVGRLPADRLHRAARRLGHHRIGPSALGRVWPDAHRRRGDAGRDRRRGRDLARGLRDRLRADLPGRDLLHGAAGPAWPAAAGGRRRRRPARRPGAAGGAPAVGRGHAARAGGVS